MAKLALILGTLLLMVFVSSTRPSPAQPHASTKTYEVNTNLIRRIKCVDDKKGQQSTGTAFIVEEGIMLTAAHVVKGICVDDESNAPVWVGYLDHNSDFAILHFFAQSPYGEYIKTSCGGFEPFESYLSFGFSHGEELRMTTLIAQNAITGRWTIIEGKSRAKLRVLNGALYQGMSGGPVFDQYGVAIGINTATNSDYDRAFSRDLRDTVICQAGSRKSK